MASLLWRSLVRTRNSQAMTHRSRGERKNAFPGYASTSSSETDVDEEKEMHKVTAALPTLSWKPAGPTKLAWVGAAQKRGSPLQELLLALSGPRHQEEVLGFLQNLRKEGIETLQTFYGLKGAINKNKYSCGTRSMQSVLL